jgi:hypothetical protein
VLEPGKGIDEAAGGQRQERVDRDLPACKAESRDHGDGLLGAREGEDVIGVRTFGQQAQVARVSGEQLRPAPSLGERPVDEEDLGKPRSMAERAPAWSMAAISARARRRSS